MLPWSPGVERQRLAGAAAGGGGAMIGALMSALWHGLRCRHPHEIWRRGVQGQAGLECWRCGRWRSVEALAQGVARPRLTAPVAQEMRCEDVIAALERRARLDRAGAVVKERYAR